MSEEHTDPKEPELTSIFDGNPEPPAEGAMIMDESEGETEAGRRVERSTTEQGHLKARVELGDVDPFDHGPEQAAIRDQKMKDGTAPPPLPDDQEFAARNPRMMVSPTDALRDEMERRFAQESGQRKVKVTPAERDAFVRAATHDEELQFDIELEGVGVKVKIAIPPEEFTSSVAAAAYYWGKEGFIDKTSDLQWLLAFQQMHAWYQVREINGVAAPWSDFWADGIPPLSKIRKKLRKHEEFEPFFVMNATRWKMLLEAVRTAEAKYSICLKNWHNRTFFTGADTD